jgi:hypothetical protein
VEAYGYAWRGVVVDRTADSREALGLSTLVCGDSTGRLAQICSRDRRSHRSLAPGRIHLVCPSNEGPRPQIQYERPAHCSGGRAPRDRRFAPVVVISLPSHTGRLDSRMRPYARAQGDLISSGTPL